MRTLLVPLSARLIVYTAVVLVTALLLHVFLFWSTSILVAIPLVAFGDLGGDRLALLAFQLKEKRMEVREILGGKLMREITLK